MSFAVAAQRFLAILALDRVLENIITNSTNQFWEKCLDMLCVVNFVLFKHVLLVLLRFVYN